MNNDKIVHVGFMVRQKPAVGTQKIKRTNLSIPLKKIFKPQRKKAREVERNKRTTKQPGNQ